MSSPTVSGACWCSRKCTVSTSRRSSRKRCATSRTECPRKCETGRRSRADETPAVRFEPGQPMTMPIAVTSQLILLGYHQVTTWVDLHPFNGARHYSRKEKLAEAGANAVLMSLAPIGFGFHVKALMTFGVAYYFVLFAIELLIWWVP